MKIFLLKAITILVLFISCAGNKREDDPLKNTKQLVIRGHSSLYNNGAFGVKGTSIKFIPAFEEGEIYLFPKRIQFARSVFSKSIKRAAESVIIVKEGTRFSFKTGDKVSEKTDEAVRAINSSITKEGVILIEKSVATSLNILGGSWKEGMNIHETTIRNSVKAAQEFEELAKSLEKNNKENYQAEKLEIEKKYSEKLGKSKEEMLKGLYSFVIGYTNLGDDLASVKSDFFKNTEDVDLIKNLKDYGKITSRLSDSTVSGLKDVFFDYGKESIKELSMIPDDFSKVSSGAGLSLAILKSILRTTKAILFDGIIIPFGELAFYSAGFVLVNGSWVPVAMVETTKATAVVLTQVVWASGKGAYYIIAPSGKAGLAALLGSAEILAFNAFNVGEKAGNTAVLVNRKIAATAARGTGFVSEYGGTYIAAPVSAAGVTIGEGIVGGGVLLGGSVAGGALSATGAVSGASVFATGKAGSLAVKGVGTAASVAVGGIVGIYYVTKAIGIPTGVALGSGVVMSYEMVAQLSAHTILGLTDFSYLVLSLEGGKWVVYAVKDVSGKAKYLLTGSVVDLNSVRKNGDEIVRVPLTPEEEKDIMDNAYKSPSD
ncbi:MAG: hypothetical protein K8R21_05285 [Leptospira sp.]|nr:hypothetical protein [Leptospira sp.]